MSTAVHERPDAGDGHVRELEPSVPRDELLARYLGALRRHGDPEPAREAAPEGGDVRTCARCGETTLFRLDPEGGWAFCTSCERAA